jgi:hypothetical protein
MIKDVMVRLDGTSGDDVRLAAVNQIAEIFESHITGLFWVAAISCGRIPARLSMSRCAHQGDRNIRSDNA